ncbi:MAG: ATP-binding cassette domain-containing protein [Candidatus Humimicrobiaceae bacterium]
MNNKREVILKVEGLTKSFGSVMALDNVSFEVYKGEILGIVGDNGAGKSTLIKIISGNFLPDKGNIYINGKKVIFRDPHHARNMGIETVYQDLSICNNLDSVSNLFIGREIYKNILGFRILNTKKMTKIAKETFSNIGINMPSVVENVEYLSGGQRQAVALARFLAWGKELVLLDEPTAALGINETRKVLDLIKNTKRNEVSKILISHNLQQVFEIVDRILVLRLGGIIGIREKEKTNPDEIVSLITGSIFVNNPNKIS